jgi:uncharacterized protein (TIGR03437 family)
MNSAGRSSVGEVLSFTAAAAVPLPYIQQGGKLIGTGAGSSQGSSVALSSDGSTAIVGGSGAAWVYSKSAGVWTQQGAELSIPGASHYLGLVALSADGNTALEGDQATVWVLTRSGSNWNRVQLTIPVTSGTNIQYTSLALSGDGNTAVVGGAFYNRGTAWVFVQIGGLWRQQAALSSDNVGPTALLGFSVSLSTDGNTALIGAPGDLSASGPGTVGIGSTLVFTRAGGVWTQQVILGGSGFVGYPGRGTAVSLSGDGNTALVSGPSDSNTGAVWVFTRSSGGVWSQQGNKLVVGVNSISLSADGTTALLGASAYTREGGAWTQEGAMLVPGDAIGYSYFGSAVALSGDASTVIIGGSGDNGTIGAAWIFTAPLSSGVNVGYVLNGASFTPSFAAGMLMSVFGTGLSTGSPQTVSSAPLPLTSSSGTSVTINGIAAPLLYIAAAQINLQIPYEVAIGTATLTVKSGGKSASISFQVQAAAPGIFVDSNNQNIVPNESAPAGSTIGLFVTGAGQVTPSEATGNVPAAGTTPIPDLPVTMTVGGVPAALEYKGLPSWSVGALQINFTVPPNVATGSQPVVVTIGGIASKTAFLMVTSSAQTPVLSDRR